MTKVELVSKIADKAGLTKKEAEKALNAVVETVTDALNAGEKVSLIGFGTFEVKTRAAKEGINPKTKAKIAIPARKVPTFKAGKALKDSVAK
ncbi:MAG: HU family DNA-binding protein [Oscillospiraceae bacterium]|nr:HU family DNA-binding protein [Oscillospiraceae bacterium]